MVPHEIRWDPTKNYWIIVSPHRKGRPVHNEPVCPFCPGAPEIPKEDWDVLVLPNRFPSLKQDYENKFYNNKDIYKSRTAYGKCEVVIYSPSHTTELEELHLDKIVKVIKVWQLRFSHLSMMEDINYVLIFENRGRVIGTTLDHPHGQIYAFPYIPKEIRTELHSAKEYMKKKKSCIYCDILKSEVEENKRIVAETDHFVAFLPYWAHFPFEVHIYSKRHIQKITQFTSDEITDFARILRIIRLKYNKLYGFKLPFMMIFHQAPTDYENYEYYHFHVEFYPVHRDRDKIKYPAGVEFGAGTFINPSNPEENAKILKEIEIDM